MENGGKSMYVSVSVFFRTITSQTEESRKVILILVFS